MKTQIILALLAIALAACAPATTSVPTGTHLPMVISPTLISTSTSLPFTATPSPLPAQTIISTSTPKSIQFDGPPPLPKSPQSTEQKGGHLGASQSTSVSLDIDSDGGVIFLLKWNQGDAPSFTLTKPDGQVIDPSYADAHPEEVTYEILPASPINAPLASYEVDSAQIGTWRLNITALDAIDYQVSGWYKNATRTLTTQTDLYTYQIGNTATITATLDNHGVGLPGATVTATLTRMDGVVDTLNLTDPENDGTYTGVYIVPDSSGFLTIAIHASGNDNGTAFTRQSIELVTIASNDIRLTDTYTDTPKDENTDGLYEYLDFTLEVYAEQAGEYDVSAELYVGDQLITHAGDFYIVDIGTQTITLRFPGTVIRQMGINGPFTIKNLFITPLDTGVTAISVETLWTTNNYSYLLFQ